MNVVLFKPEIPPNTGNISRLCVCTDASLHIVGKPSFDLSEKAVRRAGLDYWDHLRLKLYEDWEEFKRSVADPERIFLVTKFGETIYSEAKFIQDDFLLFGNETSGVPEPVYSQFPATKKLKIPMKAISRSINLSNSVAIVLYEALRQTEHW